MILQRRHDTTLVQMLLCDVIDHNSRAGVSTHNIHGFSYPPLSMSARAKRQASCAMMLFACRGQ